MNNLPQTRTSISIALCALATAGGLLCYPSRENSTTSSGLLPLRPPAPLSYSLRKEDQPLPGKIPPPSRPAGKLEAALTLGAVINTPLEGGPLFKSSILSRREAGISFARLAELRASGQGRLLLDLGLPEGPVEARLDSVIENMDGGFSMVGGIQGAPMSSLVLTVQDQAMVGDITLSAQREFLLLPGAPGAPHELRQINRSLLPICAEALEAAPIVVSDAPLPDTTTDLPGAEALAAAEDESGEISADTGTPGSPGDATGSSNAGTSAPIQNTLDVMILYTSGSVARMGSLEGQIAAMNQAVTQANLAFRNSAVPVALRLAHHEMVSYPSGTMRGDLTKLQRANDGFLDTALQLRDQYAIDNVSVWHNYMNDSAGVGFLARSASIIKNYGFNIVDVDYAVSNQSWVHEVGHNMGMNHDKANSPTAGFNSASYGHRFTGATTGILYQSIMAYPPGRRLPQFSNPNVDFDGVPTGTAAANNAAVGLATKGMVEAIRVPVAPAITKQPQDTAISYGQSATLRLTATGTAPVYQWLAGDSPITLEPLPGETGPSLLASPPETTLYQCVVQNGAGTLYSDVVSVQVD